MTQKIEFTAEEDKQFDDLIDMFVSDDTYSAHILMDNVWNIRR